MSLCVQISLRIAEPIRPAAVSTPISNSEAVIVDLLSPRPHEIHYPGTWPALSRLISSINFDVLKEQAKELD